MAAYAGVVQLETLIISVLNTQACVH